MPGAGGEQNLPHQREDRPGAGEHERHHQPGEQPIGRAGEMLPHDLDAEADRPAYSRRRTRPPARTTIGRTPRRSAADRRAARRRYRPPRRSAARRGARADRLAAPCRAVPNRSPFARRPPAARSTPGFARRGRPGPSRHNRSARSGSRSRPRRASRAARFRPGARGRAASRGRRRRWPRAPTSSAATPSVPYQREPVRRWPRFLTNNRRRGAMRAHCSVAPHGRPIHA